MKKKINQLYKFYQKKLMKKKWDSYLNSALYDQRIPDPLMKCNEGFVPSLTEYLDFFKRNPCLRQLPWILRYSNYKEGKDFSLMDYGCGLGPMAYAFSNYFDQDNFYCGYEIRTEALSFLKKAYAEYKNVEFIGESILFEESYAELQYDIEQNFGQGKSNPINNLNRKPSDKVSVSKLVTHNFDVQWSHSVFTHMHKGAIINILDDFRNILKPSGICINTWFIIDKFAKSSLDSGLADRKLPIKVDGFYTYSKRNPLVCSAYEINTVKEIYDLAGHNIIDIFWGEWSGRKGNEVSYQDIVVSIPK